MKDGKTGMPLNVAKILDAAQQREEKTADDWLADFHKRSQEALAKRAAEPRTEVPPDEKAVIEALARKDGVEYDRVRSEVAKTLGIRVGTLDDRVAQVRKMRPRSEAPEIDAAKASATAGDLTTEPNVLVRFGKAVESGGLVGETNNAKILYLALTSRLFERPVSIALKGVSAGGKSFTVESVLKFFPASAFFARTGFSEKALYFSEEDFRHRFIVIFEAVGMESDYLSYVIRTLLSENRLSYELPVKTDEGMKPQVLEKEGPTGLITTTTAARLHPENETRLLSLGVSDTRQQTAAVMHNLAAEKSAEFDYAPWQAFQEWLTTGERRVVVPYAKWLATKVPPVAVRLRRDFGVLLSLIRAHALLHRETRNKDEQGRIVAAPADYATVYHLVENLFAEGVEATVPPTVRETVEAVRECLADGGTGKTAEGAATISLTALAKRLGLDKNSAHHRVRKATALGYLMNLESRKGKPAQLVLADPLPEEDTVLPEPGALECWSDFRGDPCLEVYPTAVGNGRPMKNQGVSADAQESVPIPHTDPPENGSNGPTIIPPWGPFSRWPDDGLELPASLRRKVPPHRRPALGPEGDSLDDLV